MNYNGNMPDWHQYNPSQAGINDVTSTAQNVNSGHLSFVSNINSNCPTQLNNLNLSSDGLEKHQNDPNFNPRHFQHLSANISHGHNATDNAPLASMVQMQNCIGHYGPSNTRNPIVDNLNGPIDPRNTAMSGLNEELNYRGNQMPLNGPISHLNGSNVINMNAPHGSIGPRNTVNSSSHATNRTGHPPPSFVSCKGMCCNPDSNYQQWEKYCSYQNNVAYRENVRTNGYQADARRFGGDFNFRKDNFDGKEVLPSPMVPSNAPNASDHRRNFPDFKYRKERALSRSYSSNTGMLQSYPMQNYSYTGDYQKYSYPNIKEYSKVNNMNVPPNQAIIKHQDQNFVHQQKYNNNNKSIPYQNTGTMMSSGMPPTNHVPNPNMISPAQNTYFNSQYPRNLSTDTSHDCQHSDNCQITNDNATMMNVRMQTSSMHASSHAQYQQVYQQKIAMQRFSMENHLREMTRIPGYQSHPKYKECVLRYREILKLQSVTYQGQIPLQQTPCVATTTVNTAVPPINLQFDQNGVLINSNYMPESFPRIQQVLNSQASDNSADKQNKQDSSNTSEIINHNVQKQDQLVSQQHDNQTTVLCSKDMQQQDRYSAQKNLDQNQFEVQKTGNENFSDLNANASDTTVQRKISKEFADKPELDVRQFLANWDESEDEDGTNTNLPNAVLSDSTPVVVVGYENVNLSTKTLEEASKPQEITTNVIAFENQDKNNGVIPAQDCLTISYASTENVEIMKNSTCKEIAKENIIQPGSHIIQCISNGPNEVPTIHIVDNLEIGSILQVTNGQVTETLNRQDTVSFFQDNTKVQAITIETDKKKIDSKNESIAKYNANLEDLSKEKYIAENASPETERGTSQTPQRDDQETVTLPTSVKNNLDTAQEMNLKKQNSFASEESHNPDDISLPDLPTSECTPISTTLNTPIHSDSEESSERVQDLTISTNPIEVMQNSPMISFTQSPTKSEPYDHLSNEEETVRNKSRHSLEGQYQTENHFKDQNNMLDHDAVLSTFEFSTNIDKNESTENSTLNKERTSLTEDAVSTNNSRKAFSLDSETERAEATDVCMTLASDEYELKIMSAQNVGTPNKSMHKYKNSSIERCMNESQVVTGQDASTANQKLQALSETSIRSALRYNDSTQLDEALQNIADKSDSVEHHQNDQVDINCEKKCTLAHLNQTTNTISSSMNAPISPKIVEEDNCPTKIAKSNPSMFGAKHPTINSDKLRKCQTSDKSIKEDSSLEKNANDNKSLKIDTRELKSSWHIKVTDKKKSISCDQAKKCLSENTEELNKSDMLRNKPRIIDNVSIDDSTERMRLLKKYRRIKPSNKSSNIEEIQTKGKDTSQETCDFAVSKICHSSSDPEQSALQIPSDKQLCQKDARFKLVEEQEKKHANILKTFVTKNVNPDFAIQVTNVNLKLKDEEQKESQHSGEETKNSGSLDAIKIEINVSCTERNTTEKLLHENIKNAVAETIGHLTSSISSGTRANSANVTEIQCDKRTICDKDGLDCPDYEKRNRSPPSTETSVYSEVRKNQNNTEVVKYQSSITPSKEDMMMDETSGLFVSRKRKSSLEQELINDIYKDNGNINIVTETALNSMENLKEHAIVRRKSVHQDTERKAVNFNGNNELKTSSGNSPYTGSIGKNITVQKKENQETSVASVCKNVRNLQDDIMFRLNAIPSTSSSIIDPNLENGNYNNSTHFDYNHFDVAPNENFNINEKRTDRWKKSKKDDKFSNFDLYEAASGYVNPIFFSANELENLNTVPVYTTKDGKITYSPNPRFTYRELIMEARTKDNYNNARESSCFAISPPLDYNCSKLRKIFKRNRDIAPTSKKKEIDSSDGKLQSSAKHINYLANKNAAHKSAHCAKPHLEFFNNDADKLYANRNNQQDGKESNKKNVVDLSFLEKQYNLDNESTSSTVKHCKMKIFTDTPDYKKGYSENSMFDSNLFLGSKVACWEETMESVKSYSSHIDRRNNDNLKELNFTEVFAAQRRLDIFLSTEQNSLNNKNNQKTNCDVANEPTLNRATCVYNIDNLHQDQNTNDPPHKQTDAISLSDQNKCNKRNDNSKTEVNDYPSAAINEYPKQESQSNEIQSGTIALAEKTQSCSPKANKNVCNVENQSSTLANINDQEMLIEHFTENASVYTKEIKSDAENTSKKQISNLNSTKFTTLPESNIENLSDEPEHAETTKESVSALNEKTDKIDDFVKNNSDSAVNEITVCQQVLSASANCKTNEEIMFVTESITDITAEIDLNKTNEENNTRDEENSTTDKKEEPVILQNLSDVVISEQPQLDEEGNEQQLQKLVSEEDTTEALNNQINDEVADNPTMTSKPIASLDLPTISTETSVCDLFANEKRDQNISEFTVIKSIIAGDKKEHQKELETKDDPKDCDSIIDSKLLCMDSSDCGIYTEDRCTLTRLSEHGFTEEDSIVPMEWETSQIQEDAVNRLCNIDESSINFVGAANSLQDGSFLDNLSLPTFLKKSSTPEIAVEIKNKSNISMPAIELPEPELENSKITPSNEKSKEQAFSKKHEKTAYLCATDCNANTKIVPKLVIKKSNIDNTICKSLLKPGCQPKIPKMIIRNARSRPGTPSIESIHEEISVQINISDRMSLTSEELYENDSESSLQESNVHRNKIPKMKIKLDDKHSNKIIRAEDTTELCSKRRNIKKTIPKVKIKNSSRIDLPDNPIYDTTQEFRKNLGKYEEKIPILKLRKQERNRSSSPEMSRKRQSSSSHSEISNKKFKKSGRDEMTGHSTRLSNFSDSTRTIVSECETKKNPLVCISEKIPKVIIKRTSASAEFKCELSKGCKDIIAKSAKWQPAVQLERYQALDSMVKDLTSTRSSISLRNIDKIFAKRKDNHRQGRADDHKLSRSYSMSNLLPIKQKQRRMSDYDCRKSDTDDFICALPQESNDGKICSTPKKISASCKSYQSDNRHRSRSRDNNSQVEMDVLSSDKKINRSFGKSNSKKVSTSQHDTPNDEHRIDSDTSHKQIVKKDEDETVFGKLDQKNIPKHSSDSINFKIALKELKTATPKMETCFVKLPDLNEISSEEISTPNIKKQIKEHDLLLSKGDKIKIKTELPSNISNDVNNDCNLQIDINSLKDANVLDNFELDRSTVIKVESSDESQSTIEILPASPDGPDELESHIIEDGDSEQLYSADAIPTQFELELEIADHSNTDLLDVATPKFDLVTNCSLHRVSSEEGSNQILQTECCNKSELSSCNKNLFGRNKLAKININDKPSPNNNNLINSAREVSSKYICSEVADSTTKNFCCNDSLIKEVLAAKETLKKCLSKSKCESGSTKNNVRPKTVAEKKQGSSFDLKDPSETYSKSNDVLQGCYNDDTSQKVSVSLIGNKTETVSNAEKSDQKHSKQSKDCFVKEKLNEKKDKEFYPEEITKDARECTSLATFRQLNQATLNESPSRTIYLSEKRKHSMDQDNNILQLQDSHRKELSCYKIPKILKSMDQGSNATSKTKDDKLKADNMPILEPEITLNFDANSDRDNSRSPPVITSQDSEDLNIESKLINEKIITLDDKVENDINVCKKSEISITDFITQLACHEKATIKHRRYCNLCERWFPTTSRHRRHLAGYQHRHIELTQRRSIHALFMLFTGKPCPRLLPANVVRNDCSVGELTPLQIAVQDVIKSFDRAQQSPKKPNEVGK